jgi:hypothetical protein
MENRELRNRIWINVVGLLLPVLALTALVLDGSSVLYYVLTALFFAGMFSTRWMK